MNGQVELVSLDGNVVLKNTDKSIEIHAQVPGTKLKISNLFIKIYIKTL